MALGIRSTMFFKVGSYGWSETHWHITAATLADARTDLAILAHIRLSLCGLGVKLIGGRVSKEGVFRDSLLLQLALQGQNSEGWDAEDDNNAGFGLGLRCEDPASCILVRAEAGEDRRKSIYLTGIPDAMIVEDPTGPDYAEAPGWLDNFNFYRAELITGKWGFRTRVRPADDPTATPQNVSGVQAEAAAPLRIGFKVPDGQAGGTYAVGDVVQLRNFTMDHPAYKTINGQYTVGNVVVDAPNNQRIYFLNGTENRDPDLIDRMGKIEKVVYNSYGYSNVLALRQGRRQRGRPFNQSPGRRTTPARIVA